MGSHHFNLSLIISELNILHCLSALVLIFFLIQIFHFVLGLFRLLKCL